jgi:pimeloyl-ACP methyl ester carboxylesterase
MGGETPAADPPDGTTRTIHRRWYEPSDRAARRPTPLILLHEGLGSISAWGSFPQTLADTTGRRVLAYDRPGYGRSAAEGIGAWPAEFMHHQAALLPELLRDESVSQAILVGHSDGATIALLHPSQGGDTPDVTGIVSLSAHVLVEPVCVEAITELRDTVADGLAARLARHHDHPEIVFDRWSEVWVSDRFRSWTIDRELGRVTCPVLAVQGGADRFGTRLQLDRLAAAVAGPTEVHELPGVDHWPHREATMPVLALITDFCDRLDP